MHDREEKETREKEEDQIIGEVEGCTLRVLDAHGIVVDSGILHAVSSLLLIHCGQLGSI